jgi:hypothetical protein
MEWTARTWFTAGQKRELWERWKDGQCVADIARALGWPINWQRCCTDPLNAPTKVDMEASPK